MVQMDCVKISLPVITHREMSLIAQRILVLGVLLLTNACSGLSSAGEEPEGKYNERLLIETASGIYEFRVERANTPRSRAKGLMYRRSMPEDAGMIFYLDTERQATMWMKNTYISLDMLFLDSDGFVEEIAENTVPHSTETIATMADVRAILELNAGMVEKLGIAPGDEIRHKLFDNLTDDAGIKIRSQDAQ